MSARKGPRKIGRQFLTLTVDPATIALLDALSRERGLSRGKLVDRAVLLLLEPFEVAAE